VLIDGPWEHRCPISKTTDLSAALPKREFKFPSRSRFQGRRRHDRIVYGVMYKPIRLRPREEVPDYRLRLSPWPAGTEKAWTKGVLEEPEHRAGRSFGFIVIRSWGTAGGNPKPVRSGTTTYGYATWRDYGLGGQEKRLIEQLRPALPLHRQSTMSAIWGSLRGAGFHDRGGECSSTPDVLQSRPFSESGKPREQHLQHTTWSEKAPRHHRGRCTGWVGEVRVTTSRRTPSWPRT